MPVEQREEKLCVGAGKQVCPVRTEGAGGNITKDTTTYPYIHTAQFCLQRSAS